MKYLIKGELFDPILFGDEDSDWVGDDETPTCGDCGCQIGEQHLECCDIERCPRCGLQFISCPCGIKYVITPAMMKNLDNYIELQKLDNINQQKEIALILEKRKQDRLKNNQDTEM